MKVLCGFLCEPVDVQLDAMKYNLIDESVVKDFERLLRSEFYSVAHIATECATFSRGTLLPYRTNRFLKRLRTTSDEQQKTKEDGHRLSSPRPRICRID